MRRAKRRSIRRPSTAALLFLLLSCGVWSCASGGLSVRYQRKLEKLVVAKGVDPSQVIFPDRLNEEMREWLYERVPPRPHAERYLADLLWALEGPDGLALQYESGYTGTAEEVFSSRQYNCLSFSHLYLALAREIGVDAQYFGVERSRRFRRDGDVVLVSGHVTVGFGTGKNRRVLRFAVRPDADYRSAKPLSDLTALGLYYSNRGAEMIQSGDVQSAAEWLGTATRLAPHLPGTWVNLGVARRRLGDLEGAEGAYLRALEVGERFFPAYRNLAALYKVRGQRELQEKMFGLLGGRGNRNPYTWLALGDHSLEQKRFAEAGRYYRRALGLTRYQAEPMAALGMLALAENRFEEARAWLAKAKEAGGAVERLAELESSLDPGASSKPPQEDGIRLE
jgi:tetratricopeptide (TPR) repeat protein